MNPITVTFFEVATPQSKKECICSVAYKYFCQGKKLQFIVENEQAGTYLDQLLWSFPVESFLPHVFKEKPVNERIIISIGFNNSWKSDALFNLTNEPLLHFFDIIELYDKSTKEKEMRSKNNLEVYQAEGRPIKMNTWGSQSLNP